MPTTRSKNRNLAFAKSSETVDKRRRISVFEISTPVMQPKQKQTRKCNYSVSIMSEEEPMGGFEEKEVETEMELQQLTEGTQLYDADDLRTLQIYAIKLIKSAIDLHTRQEALWIWEIMKILRRHALKLGTIKLPPDIESRVKDAEVINLATAMGGLLDTSSTYHSLLHIVEEFWSIAPSKWRESKDAVSVYLDLQTQLFLESENIGEDSKIAFKTTGYEEIDHQIREHRMQVLAADIDEIRSQYRFDVTQKFFCELCSSYLKDERPALFETVEREPSRIQDQIQDGEESRNSPSSSPLDLTPNTSVGLLYRGQKIDTKTPRKPRNAWTKEEDLCLAEGMARHKGHNRWAAIIADHGPQGRLDKRLGKRSSGDLKDRARNIRNKLAKAGLPLGEFETATTYPNGHH